ncbi:MAG: hypothetical protein CMJ49_07530 [Planctomycetaceae bacterium]|nr:hypothetical protein [Planctomycetaceae bacterium]
MIPRRPIISTALLGVLFAALTGCVTETRSDWRRLEAHRAYHAGDIPTARDYFAACVNEQATDWKSQYFLGRIALETGDLHTARRHLDLAYTLRRANTEELSYQPEPLRPINPDLDQPRWPTLPQIIDLLAEVIYQQDDTVRLNEFLNSVAQRSGNPNDYIRLGRFLQRSGDPDSAVTALNKAVLLAPVDDRRPYLALADFYEDIGLASEAQIALRRAYGIRPDDKLADRLRSHGIVPGPTAALPIDR